MHYFADRLQAGPFARTYMLWYEQVMRKKSIESRKYRGHSPSKRQNILIFHQNPLQHPISSLSACHVIIYCVYDWKRSISIAKLIVKRMGGRFLAFYIRGSRIFVWEGDEVQSWRYLLIYVVLSSLYCCTEGALFWFCKALASVWSNSG